mmetsp:Transcript_6702/g.16255  ORF Transcript_6702/g.16255 Transcript_6702/m.16255 type:complete len:342 (-) Transcript_6702:87-1112(-)
MALHGVQSIGQLPHVPNVHLVVGASRGDEKWAVCVERQRVDLTLVRLYHVSGLLLVVGPHVPNHEFLVVGAAPKQVLIRMAPRHVLYSIGMAREGRHWLTHTCSRTSATSVAPTGRCGACSSPAALDVPHADAGILSTRQQVALAERIPRQSPTLLAVAFESLLGAHSIVFGCALVLRVVKQQHISLCRFGCDLKGILRHVQRPVDFAGVVYPGENGELGTLTRHTKPTVVSVCFILAHIDLCILLRQTNLGHEQVVLFIAGRVCAQHHLLDRVVGAGGALSAAGDAVDGERGPLECGSDDDVVEEGGVLLPYLVVLVDELLVHLVGTVIHHHVLLLCHCG